MRNRRTRVRRPPVPRRGRPTAARGRARNDYQPTNRRRTSTRRTDIRRRNPYRRRPGSRYNAGRLSTTTIVVGSVAIIIGIVAALLAGGGLRAFARDLVGHTSRVPVDPPGAIAAQFIYTARTENDATIILPAVVQQDLLQDGLARKSIALTRVGYTGDVTTSYIDMTPRTGNSSTDPPLRVSGREVPAIEAKISGIQTDINSAATAAHGGRALFLGLTRITFTDTPVTIISPGLDLANPDNFRTLDWSVPPAEVVAEVKNAGALPTLHGPVTFVLVPTAGPQQQLGQAQKNYIEAVWTALLNASGATSVTFINATGPTASSAAPGTPTVPIPALPSTPVPQVPAGPNMVKCTVPDSYFIFDTYKLVDPAQTVQNLTPCIDAALAAHATFALDGWASYEGPLTANGMPEFNYPYNHHTQRRAAPDHRQPAGRRPRSAPVRHHPRDRTRQRRPARPRRPEQRRQPGRDHHLHHQVIHLAKEASVMSMTNVTNPRTGPEEDWEPTLTPREAVALGIPKSEYEQATLFARTTVEEHQRLGTPREQWEPTPIVNDKLAAPFIADGEQELKDRLEREADPALDESQGLVENVKANLDEIAEATQPIVDAGVRRQLLRPPKR